MKTFNIRVSGGYTNCYTVEAEDLDKARKIAQDLAIGDSQDFVLDTEEYEPTWLVTKTETRKHSCYVDAFDQDKAEEIASNNDEILGWQEVTDERGENISIDAELYE